MFNPFHTELEEHTVYWRNPTPAEIRFGHGAIHYCPIPWADCKKPNGEFKAWCKFQGLRYNRG